MLRFILILPILLILVIFALSNRAPVQIGFWPTDLALEVPLAAAILVAMGIAFLIGAICLWGAALSARGRARAAERQVRMLEAQVQMQKAQLAVPPSAPARAPALAAPELR